MKAKLEPRIVATRIHVPYRHCFPAGDDRIAASSHGVFITAWMPLRANQVRKISDGKSGMQRGRPSGPLNSPRQKKADAAKRPPGSRPQFIFPLILFGRPAG